ncbi:MAG: CinA family protein [Alphaproteobacteria bacterium]|nr:CinA family protein [Alphaproteobacteria bacterium]MCL2506002.1 CinA family protein [Alphaproteobacteria bacterium]
MFDSEICASATKLKDLCIKHKVKLAIAESCTGGLLSGAITDISGSSAVFDRGFVTYSNESKIEILGVSEGFLEQFGAVSAPVAEEMAKGALNNSNADVAISVTGIAGPSGGSPEKPVGLVYFGIATSNGLLLHYSCTFSGNRQAIRLASVKEALKFVSSIDFRDASRNS